MYKDAYLSIGYFILLVALGCAMSACGERKGTTSEQPSETAEASPPFEIRKTLEHHPQAFTQGLVFHDNKILESTGGDQSWIAEYDIATGGYDKKVELADQYFGEGITVLNDKLYQLTWKSRIGFIYNARTYEKTGEFVYDFEGWGITHDGRHLIISDGTDKLHYFDPATMTEAFTRSVKLNNASLSKLNELEMIEGYIYANQWQTNHIVKIDTATHEVVTVLDFSSLAARAAQLNPDSDVFNGIAYNPVTKDVYVTGKLWPLMYVIRLQE